MPASVRQRPTSRPQRWGVSPDGAVTTRTIFRELENRGITTPAEIGEVLDMPLAEASKLLRGHQWREGDVARLQDAAARLGVQVPGP
jgi:hypothetical protein